ncbi:hypothetical protein [Oscillibacter sp.]|uniref:hypothetical protein n=1 Tax=Oscillibacter sp. TaxID=1945593 RepID=UPI00289D9154|nr:hypothetical protein [Oscillibacter sp.]
MAQKQDHSMLYGALGGFGLFVLLPLLNALYFTWVEYTHSEDRIVFPAGTQVTRTNDYDGFPANGTATITAHILPDKSEEFAQQLQKNGFQESPIPENIQLQLRYVSEAEAAAQVTNDLWYFQDDTPKEFSGGDCLNYTFEICDLDACIYYSIEYDS